MATIYERRLRILFVIDADKKFDDTHPLWKNIAAFRPLVGETHVAVFSRQKILEKEKFIEIDESFLVYHFRRGSFLTRFFPSIQNLRFHLSWHKTFRPDVVVSFSESEGALAGFLLARSNQKKFFQSTSGHIIDQEKFTIRAFITQYIFRHTDGILVPGIETGNHIATFFNVPLSTMLQLEPPLVVRELDARKETIDFHHDYPQYNFFLVTVVYGTTIPSVLVRVYKKVMQQYPRTALILVVTPDMVHHFNHLIKKHHLFGFLVYPKDDRLLSVIAGAHVYLALAHQEDIDTTMLNALSVQVPVISNAYGIAKDIFTGTAYQKFMVTSTDTDTVAAAIVSLIEDQRLRADYALNTKLLFSKLSFDTPETYAQKLYDLINKRVRPELPEIEK